MKIEKLISVFERLLPIYENAYMAKCDIYGIFVRQLYAGLCHSADCWLNENIKELFWPYGYYDNLTHNGFIYPPPEDYKGLRTRIDFMKSEIKSLKRLQKRGYTHV